MKAFVALALLAAASAPVDHPRTYLASITGIRLKAGESISGFSIATWGVTVKAVCHIPSGWTIKAGGSATPDGVLEGQGSLGATWLNRESLKALDGLVLIRLFGPVQRRDAGLAVPATFKGYATVETEDGDRKTPLTYANLRLIRASHCAASAGSHM